MGRYTRHQLLQLFNYQSLLPIINWRDFLSGPGVSRVENHEFSHAHDLKLTRSGDLKSVKIVFRVKIVILRISDFERTAVPRQEGKRQCGHRLGFC